MQPRVRDRFPIDNFSVLFTFVHQAPAPMSWNERRECELPLFDNAGSSRVPRLVPDNSWPDGSSHEGGFRAFDLAQAPNEVIDIAVRAARPIGDGFYGVDLKETDHGIVVMEVNDNPSLEHGIEDTVGKDEIWRRLPLVHRPLRAVSMPPPPSSPDRAASARAARHRAGR